MTRSELISSLYAHFELMHGLWTKWSRRHGVGALMFFPEDYEDAKDFHELQWHFWDQEELLDYLKSQTGGGTSLEPEEIDFLSRMNANEFLSVVIRFNTLEDRHEVEIHRIDRAILN